MKCPYCNYRDSKVVDSRMKSDGTVIRRRRECLACKRRFTTKEYLEQSPLIVVKADKRREPFSSEKLISGIRLACSKRPISSETIDEIASKVEFQLREKFTEEINSREIGNLVMHYLKKLDKVAYLRFASVYLNFQDKEEFLSELKDL
ncbi:transcriptional repressor NrdR [candidate division KSB1 bacterium]|nr:transcriptional repressor NrdR [candidate division KSB1 bacterium]